MTPRRIITLYRDPIDVTDLSCDACDNYILGPLKAKIGWIRIPIRFARWWLGLPRPGPCR